MKRIITGILLVAALSLGSRSQQTDWASIEIGVAELSDGIFRLFVNNAVAVVVSVGEEGVLVVDAAYQQSTGRLMEEIRGLSEAPIEFLINTHIHGDHTGGNAVVGKDARIIAHPDVKKVLANEQRRGETVIPPFPQYALPSVLVEDELKLPFNGEIVHIKHLPGGHTSSDLIVYFTESNVLVLGDLLFADNFPFVDVNNGGHPFRYLENVSYVMENYPADAIIVGGHGPVYTMDELREWYTTLKSTMERIDNAKREGVSAEEMKQGRILREWSDMGRFFITEERWIDTVYPFL